jgi:hypothetical protein
MHTQETWYRILDLVGFRKSIYQGTFNTPFGRQALKDLARVCGANESQWNEDPARRDVLIGRREIWLYIQRMLKMSPDDLAKLMSGDQPPEEIEGQTIWSK